MLTNGSAMKPGWQFKLPKKNVMFIQNIKTCQTLYVGQ